MFRARKVAEYLYGAVHPRIAVTEGLDVKFPTDLPIPTACLRVSKTVAITTGTTGCVMVNYMPGGLITYNYANGEQSSLTVNTTTNLGGVTGTNSFVSVPYVQIPQVYDKWRLTRR